MKVELVSSPAVEPMVDPFGRHVIDRRTKKPAVARHTVRDWGMIGDVPLPSNHQPFA
jgi:hypothetical protein